MKNKFNYQPEQKTENEEPNIIWRAVLLRALYYLFFVLIFVIAFFIFMKLADFYFYIPSLEKFLNSFISYLNV
jgi:hypothetical protein